MFKRPYFQRIKTFIIKDALWDIEVVMPSGAILKGYIGKVDKGDNRVRLSVILDTTGNGEVDTIILNDVCEDEE